jgi:hypothetical protein
MGSDRYHWDLVSDGDSCPAKLAAANAKIMELEREIAQFRAAAAADEERVRSVVREAAMAELTERKLYIVKPQQPTMGEIALEAYGHGKSCDAVALQGDDLQAQLDAIASRAAKQLASAAVRLSDNDRRVLIELSGHMKLTAAEQSLIDRLLATRITS